MRKRKPKIACLFLTIAVLAAQVGCEPYEPNPPPTPTPASVVLRLTASTALLPAASALVETYSSQVNPGLMETELIVSVEGRPADQVIEALEQGAADAVLLAGELAHSPPADLEVTPIGQMPLAIVVHRSNPVGSLTQAQAREIFTGKVLDWVSVGGEAGPIRVITQPPGSGPWTAIRALLLGQAGITPAAMVVGDDRGVVELVAREPGAIGYAAVSALPPEVRVVAIDGISPTLTELAAGHYPLVQPIHIVTVSDPPAHVRALVDFILSPAGQEVLGEVLRLGDKP